MEEGEECDEGPDGDDEDDEDDDGVGVVGGLVKRKRKCCRKCKLDTFSQCR